MKTCTRGLTHALLMSAALASLLPGACLAQAPATAQPPASAQARPDDIEPGVDTSAEEHAARDTPAAPATAGRAAAPANAAKAATKGAAAKGAAAKGATGKPLDHLQLDETQITGNRELPKVMVIVPWKHADLGDLAGKPMNSLVDEVLQPVDRDVFQRQTRYYDALKPDGADAAVTPPPGPGGGP